MKFALITLAASLVAGGVAFALTSPAAPANNVLAGDWRCNDTVSGHEGVTLMTVATDGAAKSRFLFNDEVEGHRIVVNGTFSGRVSIEKGEFVEAVESVRVTDVSLDGQPVPAALKAEIVASMKPQSFRYKLDELAPNRLIFSDKDGRSLCDRAPTALNL